MNVDQQSNPKRWRRVLLGILDVCGGLGGLSFAAGAILRLWLGSDVAVSEYFIMFPFIIGGLALSVIPRWKTPRIVVGVLVAFVLIVSFIAAFFMPNLHRAV